MDLATMMILISRAAGRVGSGRRGGLGVQSRISKCSDIQSRLLPTLQVPPALSEFSQMIPPSLPQMAPSALILLCHSKLPHHAPLSQRDVGIFTDTAICTVAGNLQSHTVERARGHRVQDQGVLDSPSTYCMIWAAGLSRWASVCTSVKRKWRNKTLRDEKPCVGTRHVYPAAWRPGSESSCCLEPPHFQSEALLRSPLEGVQPAPRVSQGIVLVMVPRNRTKERFLKNSISIIY